MRIALISDLHGNEVALRTALADAERAGVDRVICLGDVATLGPRPREVIAILREMGCLCILGNHDAFMLDHDLIHSYSAAPIIVDAVDRCLQRLTPDDIAFLEGFVDTATLPLPGDGELFLFHGTPTSHMEDLLVTTPPAELDALLDGRSPTVAACGHTHVPMIRRHRETLFLNPGSVGAPFSTVVEGAGPPKIMPWAEYAVVEATEAGVKVDLRRLELDRAALREQAMGWDNPLRDSHMRAYA